ncbi:ACP phosphodiesterase [Actinomadura sp. CNU-125]|uniref:NAD(P)H-dependent oxidoreductase n=1 Tax=Actinomadura sp. CNU-125 TaxID=1904961 RepID=UPI0009671067|nr:NAD(P)H-dependent oxidoreductase [Actinomadura sp. CNU-125]OLT11251.1 ACP phosphodiesterase [Actinomadura sp. CNU-125]
MKLFRLDASITPGTSASAEIADLAEAGWTAANPGTTVTRRHLGTDALPGDAWTLAVTAGFTPEDDRTPAQRDALALGATLAAELQDADAAILAVPLYNYGVSQHFKTWADLVIAGAGATTPVLENTPTALVTTLGGGYGAGAPREGWDHSTPYLERVLGDIWRADLTVIKREFTLAATTPGMEGLRDIAKAHHDAALAAARDFGSRALAAS